MRCYICDSVIATPIWNRPLNNYEPCTTCLDIIHHVFEDIPDEKQEEEEEPVDDSLEGLETNSGDLY